MGKALLSSAIYYQDKRRGYVNSRGTGHSRARLRSNDHWLHARGIPRGYSQPSVSVKVDKNSNYITLGCVIQTVMCSTISQYFLGYLRLLQMQFAHGLYTHRSKE